MTIPKLTPAFNLFIKLALPLGMGPGNEFSSLSVVNGDGGYVETADGATRFDISVVTDWLDLTATGTTATVDSRISSRGPGGINLDIHCLGKYKLSPRTIEVFSGTAGASWEFGEEYLYMSPRVFSRSPEFGWVNDTVFLAQGKARCLDDGKTAELSYEIFRVG